VQGEEHDNFSLFCTHVKNSFQNTRTFSLGTFLSDLPLKTPRITMSVVKRSRDGTKVQGKADVDSPYIAMFEAFRTELDEHHDRREKIIKASRDVTASSKKM
jgi:hypothetical protein